MARVFIRMVGLGVAAVLAVGGLWWYNGHNDERDQVIEQQREQIETLENIAGRLQADRRVADLLVTDQTRDAKNVLHTSLLFVEYDRKGQPLPPRKFEVVGDQIHIDSKLIKFDRGFVREGDELRGQSIALFSTIYGSATAPDAGAQVDTPGQIPHIYRGADPRVSEFERELWDNFWRLTEDEAYAREKGVRVAHGQGVFAIFRPDRLYTIELENAGGLTLRNKPLEPIYREAFDAVRTTGPTTRTTTRRAP